MKELRNRGVEDILIAVADGLKGFPEAITTVFPLASVQTCIVHLSPIACTSHPSSLCSFPSLSGYDPNTNFLIPSQFL